MAGYCSIGDINIGAVRMPRMLGNDENTTNQVFIDQAADDINAALGQVYKLPLNLEAGSPDALLLKKINRMLASGNILLAAASGAEDTTLHSYGYWNVKEAQKALQLIITGEITLSAALKDPDPKDFAKVTGPAIINKDDASFVDGFYGSHGSQYPNGQSRPFPWR